MLLRLWFVALLVTLAPGTVAAGAAGPTTPSAASVERAADELTERLVAPCCWRESLRSHPSPLADQLRLEIRTRLGTGEPAAAIEDDLIERYGPRVRAFSADWDPRRTVGVVWVVVSLGLFALLVRWVRRQRRARPVAAPPPVPDDRYDEALDDELARYDV